MTRRAAPEWLTAWEYAHRGLHSATEGEDRVPENSLAAADAAIAAGMGIECDIQRSLDDLPMVLHDWDLERLTGHIGETDRFSAAEIGALRYVGTEEGPASLEDFLARIAGRVPLLIEIKSKPEYDVEWTCLEVAAALQNYDGACAVMSFDPAVCRWFRRHSPDTPKGLVMREDEVGHTPEAWQRRLAFWRAKPDFLAYHVAALPNAWVAGLREEGLPILTWTVDTTEARSLAALHADALISEGAGLP